MNEGICFFPSDKGRVARKVSVTRSLYSVTRPHSLPRSNRFNRCPAAGRVYKRYFFDFTDVCFLPGDKMFAWVKTNVRIHCFHRLLCFFFLLSGRSRIILSKPRTVTITKTTSTLMNDNVLQTADIDDLLLLYLVQRNSKKIRRVLVHKKS